MRYIAVTLVGLTDLLQLIDNAATNLLAGPRQRDRADAVDLVGCPFVQLTEWIIRHPGKVNDPFDPLDILRGNLAHVLTEGERTRAVIIVKLAIAVKSAINPDNVEPPRHELRSENDANISLDKLGRRRLYATMGGQREASYDQMALLWVLNFADGHHSLLDIAERAGVPFAKIRAATDALVAAELLEPTQLHG